jgi:hydroxymethylpyrimidine pyrophosphatase-like HAD family hydrolase
MIMPAIRLIVTDIDGCLNDGEAQPYDLEDLRCLLELNKAAARGENVPAVTFCTGRPAAYVDALIQVVGGVYPAVFEAGAGLYIAEGYRFIWNPQLPPHAAAEILPIKALLQSAVVDSGVGYFQPGKEMSLTLLPEPGHTLAEIGRLATEALSGKGWGCHVEVGATTVGIRWNGISKESGVKWLSQLTGIPLSQMAGIGDEDGDIGFMKMVGFSATPCNATNSVKEIADYVSPYESGKGFADIIKHMRRL